MTDETDSSNQSSDTKEGRGDSQGGETESEREGDSSASCLTVNINEHTCSVEIIQNGQKKKTKEERNNWWGKNTSHELEHYSGEFERLFSYRRFGHENVRQCIY